MPGIIDVSHLFSYNLFYPGYGYSTSIYAGMSFNVYIFYWDVSDIQVSKSSSCSWNESDLRLRNFPYVKLGTRYITFVASLWSLWFLWSFIIFEAYHLYTAMHEKCILRLIVYIAWAEVKIRKLGNPRFDIFRRKLSNP